MPNFLRNLIAGLLVLVCIPAVAQPVINVTPSQTSGCAPLYVVFTNNTSGVTTHAWSFNPGSSNVASPGWTFLNPGTYTVNYTASNSGGSSNKQFTITVNPSPVVDFTATPASGCADLPVQLTDASNPGGNPSAATYSWVAGPYVGNAKNPNVTFAPCGQYNVSLKVKNSFGCEATVVKSNYINVFCKPNVSFAASPTTHCLVTGGPTTFTSNFTSVISGGTSPYSYDWSFGQGPNSSASNPSNTYTTAVPANYSVKLTVTDANGCKAELNKPDYIQVQKVTPNFTAPASACVFAAVNVTNTSTPGITYTSWDWGDFSGNTLNSPATHYYSAPGTYKIKLTTQNGACQDTISKTIVIHPQPNINFSFTPPKPCPAPQTLNFSATGASTYTWDFGGPTVSGTNVTRAYINNGFYSVTLIGQDNNGCKDTLTYTDTVKIYDGILEIGADTPGGCIPKKVCFNSWLWTTIPFNVKQNYPHARINYLWEFGDGNTSTAAQHMVSSQLNLL
jgi:PKD repeat protein